MLECILVAVKIFPWSRENKIWKSDSCPLQASVGTRVLINCQLFTIYSGKLNKYSLYIFKYGNMFLLSFQNVIFLLFLDQLCFLGFYCLIFTSHCFLYWDGFNVLLYLVFLCVVCKYVLADMIDTVNVWELFYK